MRRNWWLFGTWYNRLGLWKTRGHNSVSFSVKLLRVKNCNSARVPQSEKHRLWSAHPSEMCKKDVSFFAIHKCMYVFAQRSPSLDPHLPTRSRSLANRPSSFPCFKPTPFPLKILHAVMAGGGIMKMSRSLEAGKILPRSRFRFGAEAGNKEGKRQLA